MLSGGYMVGGGGVSSFGVNFGPVELTVGGGPQAVPCPLGVGDLLLGRLEAIDVLGGHGRGLLPHAVVGVRLEPQARQRLARLGTDDVREGDGPLEDPLRHPFAPVGEARDAHGAEAGAALPRGDRAHALEQQRHVLGVVRVLPREAGGAQARRPVEGVHFERASISAHDLGAKAVTVNVSDLAAMGASPRYALVSIALPPDVETAWVMELAGGMRDACGEYALTIVGGDTNRADLVVVSVTVVGEVAPGRAGTRSGARVGDRIVVTGALARYYP